MTLNSVVFPAPFGPINAVTELSATSNVAPFTARMPPNCFTSSSTCRIGSAPAPSVTEHHLFLLPEDALRAECHQQDQHEPDDHEAQCRDTLVAQGQVDEAGALEDRPHDDRPC